MESGSQYLILNQLFNDSFAVLLRRHLRKLLDFSVIENKLPNTQQNKTKQKRKQVVCEESSSCANLLHVHCGTHLQLLIEFDTE